MTVFASRHIGIDQFARSNRCNSYVTHPPPAILSSLFPTVFAAVLSCAKNVVEIVIQIDLYQNKNFT